MKDKKYNLMTSAVILLPVLVGVLLWNQLPEKMPTHFGVGGNADGWSGKPFAVFGLPLIFLGGHWLCLWVSKFDRRNWEHNEKMMQIIFWLFPVMSLVMNGMIYSIALNLEWNISRVMQILLGLFFICMGNYLPKCRQNATLGIKLPWTLYNEENWNRTHRFGGKCWVVCGMGFMGCSFLSPAFGTVTVAMMLAMVLVPTLYSYLLYKKQVREGTWTESEGSKAAREDPKMQRLSKVGMVAVVCILILVALILFTGTIEVTFQEDHFTVEATYADEVVVYYDTITAVEFRSNEPVDGTREWGFGSPRLLLGLFRNEEFGQNTRYTYTASDSFAIVYCGEDVLVLSGETDAETEEIAKTLSEKIG